MKRLLIFSTLICILANTQAQNISDAVMLTDAQYGSTARSAAMAGAFSSLGGDFSGLAANPSGIGVYRGSEFTITPMFSNTAFSSNFNSTHASDAKNSLNLGNLGLVLNFNTENEEGWQSVNFGFGYNCHNIMSRNTVISGKSNSTNIGDYFLENSRGHPDDLNSYFERLAFDARAIDTMNGNYFSPIPYGTRQKNIQDITGSMGEWNLVFGANYNHKLYVGASFNIKSFNYSETTNYYEQSLYTNTDFQDLNFRKFSDRLGYGTNFKIGAIFKPNNNIRLAAAIHAPTFFTINESFKSQLTTNLWNQTAIPTDIDGYPLGPDEFEYKIETPFKYILGTAYTFQKLGLISVDYEFVNYRNTRFSATNTGNETFNEQGYYSEINDEIKNNLQATHNLRLGAEAKLAAFYIRGGYGFQTSPYKNFPTNGGRGTIDTYSGGFGYRENSFFVDLAYTLNTVSERYKMYDYSVLPYSKNYISSSKFLATVGFRF